MDRSDTSNDGVAEIDFNKLLNRTPKIILKNWSENQLQSLQNLFIELPSYLFGRRKTVRKNNVRSYPKFLLWNRREHSIFKWNLPELEIRVADGCGEHYGHPRHYVLLKVWWNHTGYVTGVYFKA